MANRSRTDIAARSPPPSRGVMGHRGSSHHVRSGTEAICHRLYLLFAWRSGRIAGTYEGLPRIRKTWRGHVARRQGRSAAASEGQRTVGVNPSAHDATRSSPLDLLLARSPALGQSQARVGSTPGRVVECEQVWI